MLLNAEFSSTYLYNMNKLFHRFFLSFTQLSMNMSDLCQSGPNKFGLKFLKYVDILKNARMTRPGRPGLGVSSYHKSLVAVQELASAYHRHEEHYYIPPHMPHRSV